MKKRVVYLKKEILSIILAIFLSSLFLIVILVLVITKFFTLEAIIAEIAGILINVGIIGVLVWGFKPAIKLLIYGKQPRLSNLQLKTQAMQLSTDIGFL
jgi:hypothetical protein